MRRTVLPTLVLVMGIGAIGPAGWSSHKQEDRRTVRVMTRNLYHGVDAEIFAVPTASNLPALLQGVRAVYDGYYLRRFPARAAALAREIADTAPDLVGLQEVMLIRTQAPWDGNATPATTVELDYLEMLLDALRFLGLRYSVVAEIHHFDIEMPALCSSAPAPCLDVRHTVRDVILAKHDMAGADGDRRVENIQTGRFSSVCSLPSAVTGPIPIARGWASVDVRMRGQRFRFISTHLDGDCLSVTSAIQLAQAKEILSGPAATSVPVVLLGDLNSAAGSGVTYQTLLDVGFLDALLEGGGDPAAVTCCQADDLMNATSELSTRIDHVMFRGPFEVEDADIVGEAAGDRTPGELWPSDHAGVVVTLKLTR